MTEGDVAFKHFYLVCATSVFLGLPRVLLFSNGQLLEPSLFLWHSLYYVLMTRLGKLCAGKKMPYRGNVLCARAGVLTGNLSLLFGSCFTLKNVLAEL